MTVVEHSTYELLRTFQLHIETKNCQFNRVFGKYQRNYSFSWGFCSEVCSVT